MDQNMQQFFQLLNTAGQLPSRINAENAEAINAFGQGDYESARRHVVTAEQFNEQLGAALSGLERWGFAQPGAKAPSNVANAPGVQGQGLPPGKVVVNVGSETPEYEGTYSGPIDPHLLTQQNYTYIAIHLADFSNKWGQVFASKPSWSVGGHTFAQGELAQRKDEDPIVRDAAGNQIADLTTYH